MKESTIPKVKYAKDGESETKAKKLERETQLALIQTQTSNPTIRDLILKIAKIYDLPALGITILGGKPYVNVTGLDDKINKRWIKEGWVKSEVTTAIQEATKENDYLARYSVAINMVDFKLFKEILMAIASNNQGSITPELVREIKSSCTVPFKFDGWATPETCAGIAYEYTGPPGQKVKGKLLPDNVNMMAERKASNRTKRAATDTGLTSVEEMVGIDSGVIDVDFEKHKEGSRKEKITSKKTEVKKQEPTKKEPTGNEKVKEEPIVKKAIKEEPKEKPKAEHKTTERAMQTSDVAFDKGTYDPKGPPTKWQWKEIDKIESEDPDQYRVLLDGVAVVLENELTLDKADLIIKRYTKAGTDGNLPLDS